MCILADAVVKFDEFDSEEEGPGEDFPSDLEVSDEEGEGDDLEPKPAKANGKPATPAAAAGTKRKAAARDPKKGAKRRECFLTCLGEVILIAPRRTSG